MTIEGTQRYTWWMLPGELKNALGGEDEANFKMHVETIIA